MPRSALGLLLRRLVAASLPLTGLPSCRTPIDERLLDAAVLDAAAADVAVATPVDLAQRCEPCATWYVPLPGGRADGPFDCHALCGSPCGIPTECHPHQAGGGLLLQCGNPCIGRRPAGLLAAAPAAASSDLGRWFAESARLEAASVPAFTALAAELAAHEAPARLVRAAHRAATDEVRHARLTGALARRFGALPARARVAARPLRDLEAVAIENAAEGCVRESFGAVVGALQGRRAADPLVRATMAAIAVDETRHAALAWAVDRFAARRLPRGGVAAVRDARRDAASALAAEDTEPSPSLVAAAGLPDAQAARALARAFAAAAG